MVGQVALADDLTQETFLRVIRSLPSFQGKAQFSTWVARIAVNVVREHYRQQRRRPVHSVEQVDDLISWNDSPDKNTRNAEMADDIQAALLELPEEWREAVVLVCIRGYTTSDAAKICACSIATLYWRIHQSRKKLKQRLADYL